MFLLLPVDWRLGSSNLFLQDLLKIKFFQSLEASKLANAL